MNISERGERDGEVEGLGGRGIIDAGRDVKEGKDSLSLPFSGRGGEGLFSSVDSGGMAAKVKWGRGGETARF